MAEHEASVSKTRLDALADAMFGVAMTLLVIDIRLPEAFDPKSGAELLDAVLELKSKFLVYLITFFVVGLRWMGNSKLAAGRETSLAVGLLMGRFQTDRNTAFEVLRDHARSSRRKINEVADQLLAAEETLNSLHAGFASRLKSK